MKLMKEKAEQLLQRCEVVVITSVNEEGYPRPVPMSKIKSEGYSVVWMATGNDSLKTKDFPLGPADPNYVLLKFKGQKATIWIDGVFIHE